MKQLSFSTALLAAALLGACDGDEIDAMDDAGTPDGGTVGRDAGGSNNTGTCASPRTITLTMGAQTITGDTTGAGTDLELSDCGGGEAAPQDVIALTLPGSASDTYGVRFDFAQAGTAMTFDTVTQVRETCGDDAEGALCFDDGEDLRSAGEFGAPGGATRFLVVTGYSPRDEDANQLEGAYEASVEVVGPLAAPVLTGATVLNVEGLELRFTLTGSDGDMDASAMGVQFLEADGDVIAIDNDGDDTTPPVEAFEFGIVGATGEATFTGTTTVDSEGVTELADATQARVQLIDAFGLRSATMDIALTAGSFAALGETCNATNVCTAGLECASGTCAVPAPVATVCETATAFTVPTTGETRSTVVTVPTGEGVLSGSCGASIFGDFTAGAEALVEVTGAAGYDIVLQTAGTTTASTDTVLYALTTCGDPSSEVSCNDDRDPEAEPPQVDSSLEILDTAARTYTVVVEVAGGAEAPTMVDLVGRLRPVLAAGATCDRAGVMNRCRTAACPATGEPVCP